jgi:hypothetical protein
MEIRFRPDPDPWAWCVFYRTEERGRREFLTNIAISYIGPECQREFVVPRSPLPYPTTHLVRKSDALVVIQSRDTPQGSMASSQETIHNSPIKLKHLSSSLSRIVRIGTRYAVFGARHRLEFSLYLAAVISFLGVGFSARTWLPGFLLFSEDSWIRCIFLISPRLSAWPSSTGRGVKDLHVRTLMSLDISATLCCVGAN